MSLYGADRKANDIIKKVRKKYDGLSTFYAEFTQTFHWKLADNIHQSQGKIWLRGKDKFRIETDDQTVVSNGKTVWTYSKFNNQVIIDNIKGSSEEVRLPKDIFFNYAEQYQAKYIRKETFESQDCYVLELHAKTEDIFITEMKVWISTKMNIPIKIEQVDLNKNVNTYVLKKIELNKSLDKNFFEYKIPEAVEVIDMR